MLFSFAVPRNSCVENRSDALALIFPARVVSLRHFAKKGAIHDAQAFLSVGLY